LKLINKIKTLVELLLYVTLFSTFLGCSSASVIVKNNEELLIALKNATGGEVIYLRNKLTPYQLVWQPTEEFYPNTNVTITSESTSDVSIFSRFHISNVNNLTIKNLEFTPDNKIRNLNLISISNGQNINVENNTITGRATGFAENRAMFLNNTGFFARSVKNLVFNNNQVSNLSFGIVIYGSLKDTVNKQINITNNAIKHIQGDSIRIVQSQSLLIENNSITNVLGSAQSVNHTDMIQFWTTNTHSPSKDIIIRNNFLHSGDVNLTQSIFMRNEIVDLGLASSNMFYQNISIENNIIFAPHHHGITVGESNNLNISNNTVLYNYNGYPESSAPKINVNSSSTNTNVRKNIVAKGESDDFDNFYVQRSNPDAVNYYGHTFINALSGNLATKQGLMIQPQQLKRISGYGARASVINPITIATTPRIIYSQTNTPYQYAFDGKYSSDSIGFLKDRKDFTWTFPNGIVKQGGSVKHTFNGAGIYKVILTVMDENEPLSTTMFVMVPSNTLFNLDVSSVELTDKSTNGVGVQLRKDTAIVVDNKNNQLIKFTPTSYVELDRNTLNIFERKEISIEFEINLTSLPLKESEIFSIHQSTSITLLPSGNIKVELFNNKNDSFIVRSLDHPLIQNKWYKIKVTYSSIAREAKLYINNELVERTSVFGYTKGKGFWNPVIGSMFKRSFDGTLKEFKVRNKIQ